MKVHRHIIWISIAVVPILVGLGWAIWALPAPNDASTWWAAAGTVVTALATIALVLVTALLWRVSDRSAGAAEKAALAAERAAASAEQSSLETATSQERALRAYVQVESASIANLSAGLSPYATIRFVNTGRTPAKYVRVRSAIALRHAPVDQTSLVIPPTPPPSQTTLGTGIGAQSSAAAPAPISPQDLQAVMNNHAFVFMHGEIEYKDVFEKTHRTAFRLHQNAAQLGAMTFSQEGNDSD